MTIPAAPPFRLIAIVSDAPRAAQVLEWGGANPEIGLGLMLRDPGHDQERVRALAAYVAGITCPPNITVIANGVHVEGIRCTHYTAAQVALGRGGYRDGNVMMGASAHSAYEAGAAVALGAAYVMTGPIFPTPSKPGHPGIGLETFRSIAGDVPVPVFALGGINAGNAVAVFDAGAWGLAGISLWDMKSPEDLEHIAALIRDRFLSKDSAPGG